MQAQTISSSASNEPAFPCIPGRRGPGAGPVLSVADFNGDTIVDGEDVREIAARISRRDSAAFFDMNADGRVDITDLRIVSQQIDARSTATDQELAAVFRATERCRDIRNAVEGGCPLYQESLRGPYGVHRGRRDARPGTVELTRPFARAIAWQGGGLSGSGGPCCCRRR